MLSKKALGSLRWADFLNLNCAWHTPGHHIDKYNQRISEILDAKSKEIAIKGEKADLLIKIADLEAKNQELKRQITLMELCKH